MGDKRWIPCTVRRTLEAEPWNRYTLSRVVGVPHENEPKVDGESLKGDVVGNGQDRDARENLEREEVRSSAYITREGLEHVGFAVRCRGRVSILKGTARQAHTVQAETGERRTNECWRGRSERGRSQLQEEEKTSKQRQNGRTKTVRTRRERQEENVSGGTSIGHRTRARQAVDSREDEEKGSRR